MQILPCSHQSAWQRHKGLALPRRYSRPAQKRLQCHQQPDVSATPAPVSLGVSIRSYDMSAALAAVSGKSFSCTMCGKCCTLQADAEVWISDAEISAMAQYLGLPAATFESSFCQPYQGITGWRMLQSKLVDMPQPQQAAAPGQQQQQQDAVEVSPQQQHVCSFLNEDKSCAVYPVRPIQCSTYPWWPEVMPARNWQAEREYMCEGFDHPEAEPLDRWYAAQQLQKATEHTLAFEAAKPDGWDADHQLYGDREE